MKKSSKKITRNLNNKTKKHKKHKKHKKKIHLSNKISIKINFTAKDMGYRDFLHPLLLSFILENISVGNNLINTQENKPFFVHKNNKLYLQAVSVKEWPSQVSWNEIECNDINRLIKATPCNIGTTNKVFLKLKSNSFIGGFGIYIIALHMGLINEAQHKVFVKTLQQVFKKNPILVHNKDVDWFHLKEYSEE